MNSLFHHEFDQPLLSILAGFKKILSSLLNALYLLIFVLLLIAFDLVISILNLLTPSLSANQTVPKTFSPDRPPQLGESPILFLLCNLAKILGPEQCPTWLKWWSKWDGITAKGSWREPKKTDLDDVSRSPCPALNALANHGEWCSYQ